MNLSRTRSIFALFLACGAVSLKAGMSHGFNQLLDSVVRIDVREATVEDGARHFDASIGSGVLLSADGLILTNAHVASPRAVEISVTLSNLERVDAELVGWDHWTDLAVLRLRADEIKARHLTFAHAEFGDSDKLFVGETVYAAGTPYGLNRTVARGIISNNNRYFEDTTAVDGFETGAFNTWLQTDAAINPGNSGGPLVTEDGRVVGITSRGYLGANNLGFAIPINIAKRVINDLVRDGSITRSYVGLELKALQNLEAFYSVALNTGVLIESVDPGSPASHAGLRAGDILLAIDGHAVDGRFPEQLPAIQSTIADRSVGSAVALSYKRGNQTLAASVTTERLESRIGEQSVFERWGLSVQKVSRAYARENQLNDETGVEVIGVQPGFPAEVAGIQKGDILVKINQTPVNSLEVMRAAHAAYEAKPEPTLIEAMRDRRVTLYILKP